MNNSKTKKTGFSNLLKGGNHQIAEKLMFAISNKVQAETDALDGQMPRETGRLCPMSEVKELGEKLKTIDTFKMI